MSSPDSSSPDSGPGDEAAANDVDPPAEEVTDPALAAEVDNPAQTNVPSGAEATPGDGSAADADPIAAPGSPGELSSDDTPAQGSETGEVAPAESVGEVVGGDAGSPESGTGNADEGDQDGPGGDPAHEQAADSDPPPPPPSATAPEQPPAPAAEADAAAIHQATEDKVAEAVAAREAAAAAKDDPVGEPDEEPGETDEARQHLLDLLARVLDGGLVGTHLLPGVDVWARVTIGDWREAVRVCRDELGMTYFCYLSAIDWLPSPYGRSEEPPSADEPEGGEAAGGDTGAEPGAVTALEQGYAGGDSRLQLIARLVSPTSHLGITLKADLDDDVPLAPSLIEIFPGADWHEREAWEMYGIDFSGHPNLIHLYLPGAFEGHPLRKDFPLLAREVKPWPGLVDVEAMPGEEEG